MLDCTQLKQIFKEESEEIFEDYCTFLRFESISADPAYYPSLSACADWLSSYLKNCGLTVELWKSSGAPVVFASDLRAGKDKETILLYCHYDVQPVDPLSLWSHPPFHPTLKDGKIYARGASDNKGQCFYTIRAIKTLLSQLKKLPFNLKFIIEGEEESGSKGLAELLKEKKAALAANHLLIVDSGTRAKGEPAITVGCRGLVCLTATLTGSSHDLHSGVHGGLVYNPNRALVELLASLHDEKGLITIPHFYDSVISVSAQEKKNYTLDFNEKQLQEEIGATPAGVPKGIPTAEANCLHPTLEINGISGGYAGPGFKTVIPSTSQAKISCRLVPNQQPDEIGEMVKQFLLKNCPTGIQIEVEVHEGKGKAFRTKPTSKISQILSKAYSTVFNKPCEHLLMGGSIPIVIDLAEAAGAEALLVGVALNTDKIHAPNEHFDMERLEQGYLVIATALQLLGNEQNSREKS